MLIYIVGRCMMKIKIVFIEPPYEAKEKNRMYDNEKIVYIMDPYNITMIDDGRAIKDEREQLITYEKYCVDLQAVINTSIHKAALTNINDCISIVIDGCKEPPNFE